MSPGKDTDTLLQAALEAHRNGQLARAEAMYQEILSDVPDHFDALHMRGVVFHQQGENERAIELLNRAIATGVQDARVFNNLGSTLNAAGRPRDALHALSRSIELDARSAPVFNNVGNAYKLLKQFDSAIAEFQKAIVLDPGYVGAYHNMAAACLAGKKFDQAEASFREILRLDPGNAAAIHMLASLRGETPQQAPDAHIKDLFDHYSTYFDSHLVAELGYDIPARVSSELRSVMAEGKVFERVLDLGCGTGLIGEKIRDIVSSLAGIDLSGQMIAKAEKRGIYDELHVCGLTDFMSVEKRNFDLITCADVFPYVGDLKETFRSVRGCLDEKGLFIFSTEKTDKYPYTLRKTGRYAHAESYLDELFELHGFAVVTRDTVNIRKQGDEWITGNFIVLQCACD